MAIIDPISYLAKDLAGDAAAIARYAGQQEIAVRRAFMEFIENVKSEDMVAAVRAQLEGGNIDAALDLINPYVQRFGSDLTDVFMDTAYDEGVRLRGVLSSGYAAAGFDPTYPRAAELMRNNRLELITNFTVQQRDLTRRVLTEALDEGAGPAEAARAFRDSMGLTPAQQDMIDNYQAALESNSSTALDRALRDRRFDSTVEAAIEDDIPLTDDQIERMVGRYSERMLAMRSETIARTETQRILNQAREEATRQILGQAGIHASKVIRRWVAIQDDRTRDSHIGLDGQERGLDEPFETDDGTEIMYPGDPDAPPEETINCRCVLQIDFADEITNDKGDDDVDEDV